MPQPNSHEGPAPTRQKQERRRRVVVIGGGIAGLYCALRLADEHCTVQVLEATTNWGGRIETHTLRRPDGRPFSYPAEFGPMRFELGISPLLRELLEELEIVPVPFPPPLSPRIPIEYPVAVDEQELGTATALRPIELLKLGVFRMVGFHPFVVVEKVANTVVHKVVLPASENATFVKWEDDSLSEDNRFDALRKKAELTFTTLNPLTKRTWKLHELGFWNALQLVLTPGAVSAINHLGSFYHLMPDNPNAAEWAIFWLRLFGPNSQLSTLPDGVNMVITKLVEKLQSPNYKSRVELLDGQRVTALRNGEDFSEIAIEHEDSTGKPGTPLSADHVILALPKVPVQKLEAVFPNDIREDLNSVVAFPLVKVFAVVRTPDRWKFSPPEPQEDVWLFPTREVHYFPVGKVEDYIMLLLYTDHPAAVFWEQYVQNPTDHHEAEIDENLDLNYILLRLLFHLHFSWAEEQLRTDSRGTTIRHSKGMRYEPSFYGREAREVLAKLWRLALEQRLDDLTTLFVSLFRNMGQSITKQQLVSMDQQQLQQAARKLDLMNVPLSEEVRRVLYFDELAGPGQTPIPDELLRQVIQVRRKLLAVDIFEALEDELFSSLGTCAIRDWSKDSYIGAGCHAWRPGARSWEVRARLKAFGLHGREAIKNVHVCGEAYSDYQGFIEGALRSAGDAVQAILDADGQVVR